VSTPGRARALRALGRRKRANTRRIAKGLKPIVGGRQMSLSAFRKKTGSKTTKAKAKIVAGRRSRRTRRGRGPHGF
jgi:hypothetical protein